MHRRLCSLLIVMLACACRQAPKEMADSGASVASGRGTDLATNPWPVRPDSFGPIALGAPLIPLNGALSVDTGRVSGCARARTASLPPGASLMLVRERAGSPLLVERVDIDSGSVRTSEGVGIGDSEESVLRTYGTRAKVQPHKYTGPTGHYVIVQEAGDTTHSIIFETEARRVVRYHAGRRPTVDLVEGCG